MSQKNEANTFQTLDWFKQENYEWINTASDKYIGLQLIERVSILTASGLYKHFVKSKEYKYLAESDPRFVELKAQVQRIMSGENYLLIKERKLESNHIFDETKAVTLSKLKLYEKEREIDLINQAFPQNKPIIGSGRPLERSLFEIRAESAESFYEFPSNMTVDINLLKSNAEILSDLEQLLDSWRTTISENYRHDYKVAEHNISDLLYKIRSYRLIQFIDLKTVKNMSGSKISNQLVLDTLFGDHYGDSMSMERKANYLLKNIQKSLPYIEFIVNTKI